MRRLLTAILLFAGALNAAVPTWLAATDSGQWVAIPNSTLSTSGVMHTSPSGAGQMAFWGGAVLATRGLHIGATFTNGTFLVPWGGGHGDYGGNEVYAFGPLESDSPAWSRLRDRTASFPTNVSQDASGNPVSRHTYNGVVFHPDTNAMIAVGGLYRYTDADVVLQQHKFKFTTVSPNTNQPWDTVWTRVPNSGADVSVYDATLNRVWYHQNARNEVCYYNVAAGTHTCDIFKSPAGLSNASSDIDTVRGLWGMWSFSGGFTFYRTNNGVANDYYRPSQTGTFPERYNGAAPDSLNLGSVVYDRLRDKWVGWFERDDNGQFISDRKIIWELTPPATNPYQGGNAWTWNRVVPTGGATPTLPLGNGTLSRLRYYKGADFAGIILMNAAADAVYFYRTTSSPATSDNPSGIFLLINGF